MRTMLLMMGCISLVLLLTTGTIFGASGKSSSGTQKKEKIKLSGWIGVMVQDVNEKIVRKEKLDFEEGVYVKEVLEDSPADSAGIKENDVIIEFNGKKVFDSDDLVKAVRRTPPKTKVNIILVREGEKKTLQLIVGRKKELKHYMFGKMPRIPDVHVFLGSRILGLRLLTLNEQLGEYFNAPNNEGVLVEEVENKSAAEKAGFKAGDVVIRVGKKTVDAAEKIRREIQKYDEGDVVEFEVIRKNERKTLNVELEEQQFMPNTFVIPKPHIRMFRTDPFDDVEMHLEMEEFPIEIKNMKREFENFAKILKCWHCEI